ncbi:glycosyltransferase family 4 protein [Barnesiella propionica]|uniref:glycosyltransferase family 4 protein n=1 Tax=Barnesiella propionica TaxID=2981781 RepID=UPI0011C76ABE|nr:glycosyltransferase family 4 protein [Barnesiella propionica]MCU6769107.1 glycosyltransferase family 4 protein [Barnesiella propionica]
MNRQEIKYIGFYDVRNAGEDRACALSACNKMDYIVSVMQRTGHDVKLISPAWRTSAKRKNKNIEKLRKKRNLYIAPGFPAYNKFFSYINIFISLLWLFIELVIHSRKNEKILVYHSEWLSIPLRYAKKIKKYKIVLQIEEIYTEVWKKKKYLRRWEKALIEDADEYILVSSLLAKRFSDKAVSSILYGSYIPVFGENIQDKDNINIVYAGGIEITRGGAFGAVGCICHLPSNYTMHICGYGTPAVVEKLKREITVVNDKLKREACVFHGILYEKDLSNLLFSCQIAVNPQVVGDYMSSAFPSKIITYLSHNLRVVTTKIESIEKSPFAKIIYFSSSAKEQDLAESILSVDVNVPYDSRALICQKDREFFEEIKTIFS